jgi:nucleoside-diphosphate-sugar epimerase
LLDREERFLNRMKARIESYIRSQQNPSLFPYTTFIHVGFYYQNFLTFFQPTADFEFRVLLQPNARLPLYDVRDTGYVVLQCFEHPDRWGQENVVPIVAERLTMDEICETIRRVTGNEKIRYVSLTSDQCVGQTKETLDNMRWYNEYGDIEERHAEKTREVYDKMKTLEEWIQETKWLMNF